MSDKPDRIEGDRVQRMVDRFPLTAEMVEKIRRNMAEKERPIVWPVGAMIPIKDAP